MLAYLSGSIEYSPDHGTNWRVKKKRFRRCFEPRLAKLEKPEPPPQAKMAKAPK